MAMNFSRAEYEFRSWVAKLDPTMQSEHEKKLLNLLLSDFKTIAAAGNAQGKRAKLLKDLIQTHRATLSSDLPDLETTASKAPSASLQIKRLEITGPFRGFTDAESFSFEKDYTIAYGENGTGKSSLCEAIECALLGTIQEAESKRIRLAQYIRNVTKGKGTLPIVFSIDGEGNESQVPASLENFRFCFIEKNRIDTFARISAATEQEQTARIAVLFGLEEFNSFVNDFTDNFVSISGFDTQGAKSILFQQKQEAITHAVRLVESVPQLQEQIEQAKGQVVEKAKLASQNAWSGDFSELVTFLRGSAPVTSSDKEAAPSAQKIGKLKELTELMSSSPKGAISLCSEGHLSGVVAAAKDSWQAYITSERALSLQKQDTNFLEVYRAVLAVETVSPDACPACSTPLIKTSKNPFDQARGGLEALRKVSELEEETKLKNTATVDALLALRQEFVSLNALFEKFKSEDRLDWPPEFSAAVPILSEKSDQALTALFDGWSAVEPKVASLRQNVNSFNASQLALLANKNQAKVDFEEWQAVADAVLQAQTLENKSVTDVAAAKALIQGFNEEQKELISEVEAEKKTVAENLLYASAYANLRVKLRAHRDNLPVQLVAGLNDAAKNFYNFINQHDAEFDKIEDLHLPSSPGEGIRLRFKTDPPATIHNALTVLSEGHIKCLGLSVLLAKCVHENCPFIVFDDIVNAVDDLHRSNIAEMLCDQHSSPLKGKKMLVSCHGEEFARKLESHLQKIPDKIHRLTFVSVKETRGIEVLHKAEARDYLSQAEDEHKKGRPREALAAARRGLETVCKKIWKQLGNQYTDCVKVATRSDATPPDVSAIIEGLHEYLGKKGVAQTDKGNQIRLALTFFKTNLKLVNTGTHEGDVAEFDQNEVGQYIAYLRQLFEATMGKDWLIGKEAVAAH